MDFIDFAAIFITVCLEYCHNDVTMIFVVPYYSTRFGISNFACPVAVGGYG